MHTSLLHGTLLDSSYFHTQCSFLNGAYRTKLENTLKSNAAYCSVVFSSWNNLNFI